MPTGAIIAGGLGAIGSIGSSLIGSNAAQKASQAQLQFGGQALSALQQYLSPLFNTGQSITGAALGPLTKLLTPGPDQTATLSQLPGFQFAQDWGQKAIGNLGSTLGFSGNTLTSGAQYATGLAQQGFGSLTGMLQNFMNTGVSALGTAGTALGSGTAGILSGMGNAAASGILGSANAISGGLTGATGALGNSALWSAIGNRLPQANGGGLYGAVSPWQSMTGTAGLSNTNWL